MTTRLDAKERAELERLRADREALDRIVAEAITTMHLGMLVAERFTPERQSA